MMRQKLDVRGQNAAKLLNSQPCIKAIKKARMPDELRDELEAFIQRNTLPDCGRVPPNCLKAHMIKTAHALKLPESTIESLKRLFKARIGYNGHYLDAGVLKKL